MNTRIFISMIVLLVVVVGGYVMYRRFITSMQPDTDQRQVNGARLTSERLRQLTSPPWRIVFEIAEDRLGGIDHVIIGPPGVIAVSTLMLDRPANAATPDPQQLTTLALLKGPVDDIVSTVGLSCDTLAKVYWGEPQPAYPAALDAGLRTVGVEGQRLNEWLLTLPPGPLTAAQVDLAWQTLLVGIGRPDPFA